MDPMPDSMPITVLPDRIMIGNQFVPRYLDLPRVKAVLAGEIWEPDADSTFDYIEVQDKGVLHVSRVRNTTLRFTHLFVHPGGRLDCGVDETKDVIPAGVRVELIVRNIPIDTTRDPFQWGNSLLNFGRQDRCGAEKLAWTSLAEGVLAGTDMITLSEDPVGWAIGDSVLIPSTIAGLQREVPCTVQAITARTIKLSKVTDFAHPAILRPDDAKTLVVFPRVLNLTRNIVVRSENPQGTPGHTACVGHHAMQCVCWNELRGLGRTKNIPLDSTSGNLSHIGTNQVARYAEHYHHTVGYMPASPTMPVAQASSFGNVLVGGRKWGLVVHATHDVLVHHNIALDFTGAGFITEDGYETRTTFDKNISCYNIGNHDGNQEIEGNNDASGNPGAAGNGFWLRSMHQSVVTGNEAWCNDIGINNFCINQVQANYPSQPGGAVDTPFDRTSAVPKIVKANVTVGNAVTGWENWGNPPYDNVDLIAAFNILQVSEEASNPARPILRNPTLVGDGRGTGLRIDPAYVLTGHVYGGYIGGNAIGLDGSGGSIVVVDGTTMQNLLDLDWSRHTSQFQHVNVTHVPYGANPHRYIRWSDKDSPFIWHGPPQPLFDVGVSAYVPQRGILALITNWQGTGKDYQLFGYDQVGSLPSWYSTLSGQHVWNTPEVGLTMQQSLDKYGMALHGDAVADTDALQLEGLEGIARFGLAHALPPPRLIITSPTAAMDTSQAIQNGVMALHAILTGQGVPGVGGRVRIDGGAWFDASHNGSAHFDPDVCDFHVSGPLLSLGAHTVETQRDNGPIMRSSYSVGVVVPPVSQPPPTGAANDATVLSIVAPASIAQGQTFVAMVTVKNTGTATWQPSTVFGTRAYRLGSQNPQDSTRWNTGRVNLPNAVAPGETVVLQVNATAPTTESGSLSFAWKMVLDTVEWFGTTGQALITVTAGMPMPVDCVVGPWVSGTPSTTLTPAVTVGDQQTRTVTVITQQTRQIITQPANGGAACPLT